jgi:hypothetical protein
MGKIPVFTRTVLPDNAVGGAAIDAARAQGDINAEALNQGVRGLQSGTTAYGEYKLRQLQADNAVSVNEATIKFKKDMLDQQDALQKQNASTPDGFHKTFDSLMEKKADDYLKLAPSEEAKRALKVSLADARASVYDDNMRWEQTRKVETFGESMDRTYDNIGAMAYRAGKNGLPVDDLKKEVDASVVAASTFVAPDKLDKIHRTGYQKIEEARLLGVIDKDPTGAIKMLDGMLTPTKGASGFDAAIKTVLGNEGGATPSDGATHAPAIYGINSKYFPAQYDEAKKITDSQGQEAGQKYAANFYKGEFWDKNKIGDLPPDVQTVVLDGAVNHYHGFVNKLVEKAKAGASADELIAMRKEEYQRLAQKPEQAGNLNSWLARLEAVKSAGPAKTSPDAILPYEKLVELKNKAETQIKEDIALRDKDPMTYAQTHGIAPNQPLAFNDPDALKTQLKARESAQQTLTASYGAPPKILTDGEAKTLSSSLNNLSTDQKLSFLKQLGAASPSQESYQNTLQQIRPDSPVTAMAGLYLSYDRTIPEKTHWFSKDEPAIKPGDVAKRIIEGEGLLNPPKAEKGADGTKNAFPMPKDGGSTGLRAAFNKYAEKSFAGLPQQGRTGLPGRARLLCVAIGDRRQLRWDAS